MEVGADRTPRAVSFVLVVIGLAAIAVGLGAMLFITAEAAARAAEAVTQKLLLRLAWLSLALLCLTLVMLVWVILRRIRHHLGSESPLKPSRYVNAWELAGKRFRLEEDQQERDGREDDQQKDQEDDRDE